MAYDAAAIRRLRDEAGLNQRAFAEAVGVTQQTVSRWESGRGRPTAKQDAALAALAGERRPNGPGTAPARPVRPLSLRLPLSGLTPRDFESFCRDFVIARHRGAQFSDASLFGGPGHKQDGIDILATVDGRTFTYQCKRVNEFGAAAVRNAVETTAIDGEHFLLLSKDTASPSARREMARHSGWVLLDGDDISRIVRSELHPADARRLVDTYFPGWRADFFGDVDNSCWLTADEFFRPSLKESAVLSHTWALVGRQPELARAEAFALSHRRAVVVVGRGGAGKSRLLREVAGRLSQTGGDVRFLAPEATPSAKDIKSLPPSAYLVVDDAHDRDDLATTLALVARARDDIRLILASRPYAIEIMHAHLRTTGFLGVDDAQPIVLADLTVEDLELLAKEVLARHGASTKSAEHIARATTDCPLFTVLAAQLVAAGKAGPLQLASNEVTRELLLSTFRDALIGGLGNPAEQLGLRDALQLVAITQPIIPDDPAFQATAEKVLGRPAHTLVRQLRMLEAAGLLVRRGRTLRVVPDLLADYLVGDACLDSTSGVVTGYADAVFRASSGSLPRNVILNVAKLDWRATNDLGRTTALLDSIWASLRDEFLSNGIYARAELLRELSDISYYQPSRALQLAQDAIDHPIDSVETAWPGVTSSYGTVLDAIPTLLRGAGYHLDHLPAVADLLWKLGRNSASELNSQPSHAIRILQELVAYEPDKPLAYNRVILESALRWLDDPHLGSYAHSPFDVLERLVATEGYSTRSRGWTLHMSSFNVAAANVRPLRDQVLDAALHALSHADVAVAVRAAAVIEAGLRYPHGYFGQDVEADTREQWTPEFVRLLDNVMKVVSATPIEPAVRDRLRTTINRIAVRGKGEAQRLAGQIVALLDGDFADRLTRALAHGWAYSAEIDDEDTDYEAREQRWRDYQAAVADELLGSRDVPESVDLIETRLRALREAYGSRINPEVFLHTLATRSREAADEMIQRSISDSPSELRRYTAAILSALRKHDSDAALAVADAVLAANDIELVRLVAAAYAIPDRDTTWRSDEIELVRRLARHGDEIVRWHVSRGLMYPTGPSGLDQAVRLRLLLDVHIDGSELVAAEVMGAMRRGDIDIARVDRQDLLRLINDLLVCTKIDEWSIGQWLSEVCRIDHVAVLKLLIQRVELAELDTTSTQYQPIPYRWDDDSPLNFRDRPDFADIITTIRTWAASGETWRREHWAPLLLAAVVRTFDRLVLDALARDAATEDELVAATLLLREMPARLVWAEADWVADILSRAIAVSEDCYRRVGGALHSAVTSGVRSGTPGQPFPEDVEQHRRSLDAAAKFPPGSPAHRFYTSLANSAAESMRLSVERDDEW